MLDFGQLRIWRLPNRPQRLKRADSEDLHDSPDLDLKCMNICTTAKLAREDLKLRR